MYNFFLTSVWRIPAPLHVVWDHILDTQNWPVWWKYVRKVEEIDPGYAGGLKNIRRYYWDTCLPYQLTMDLCITRLIPYREVETAVSGDLKGKGTCCLSERQNFTEIHYQWNVCLDKFWMKLVAPIAYPVFIWNHQRVMKQGEISLIQRLRENSTG